jgi:dTMP kinase
MNGKLIILEGPDGVGKTTIAQEIIKRHPDFHYFAFPGHEEGTIGRLVYDLHHDPAAFGVFRLPPSTLQTLHVAAHLDAVINILHPALWKSGQNVILDRSFWSTWAYGMAAGLDETFLRKLIALEAQCWEDNGIRADLMLLITRNKPIERDNDRAWKMARHFYVNYSMPEDLQRSFHKFAVIANEFSLSETMGNIFAELERIDIHDKQLA